ncbi:MAG: Fe-S cluster protein, partial [Nanoarchaeota archaeon]|nr:Fe-S cluster protein [Nanoarchaeota archaeon]
EDIKNMTSEDVMNMIGIKLGAVRMKCGLLCLNTVKKGIQNMEDKK